MNNNLLIIIILFYLPISVLGQTPESNYEIDPARDIYGMNLIFEKRILDSKCDCCCSTYPKKSRCALYRVKLSDVIIHRDSSIYNSSEDITSINYIVLPKIEEFKALFDQKYFVFARNSCTKDFLIINQIMTKRPNRIPNYSNLPYLAGLVNCKKINSFKKLRLLLGGSRDKIFSNSRELKPKDSIFWQWVEKKL